MADVAADDGGSPLTRVPFDDGASVSVTLLEALSEAGAPIESSGFVLYDVLDPDALDGIFDRGDPSVEFTMDVRGYHVVVTSDGVKVYSSVVTGE
jgi:hypothetical protein